MSLLTDGYELKWNGRDASRLMLGASYLMLCSFLLMVPGCNDEAPSPASMPEAGRECEGDFDEFAIGLRKSMGAAGLAIEIVEADPNPPVVRGNNAWQVLVTAASGEPLVGAEITVSPFMPQHQHGAPVVVVTELGGGRYRLRPIEFIMPGIWEIPIRLTATNKETGSATFRLCIAEQ